MIQYKYPPILTDPALVLRIEQMDMATKRRPRGTVEASRRDILVAAGNLALRHFTLDKVTRDGTALEAGASSGWVSSNYTVPELKDALMELAIEEAKENPGSRALQLLAIGIRAGNAIALSAPEPLRKKALAHLLTLPPAS